ncbi:MAG: hypothetical protein CM15mV42_0970 [uncultured marine virus]|nr:MAG: hypothetical protein CM15mV42_0970 [uncultured marine virus]
MHLLLLGNLNTPFPDQSTGQYSPLKQQTPPNMATAEGSQRAMELAMNSPVPNLGEKKPQIADPIYSSRKATHLIDIMSIQNLQNLVFPLCK